MYPERSNMASPNWGDFWVVVVAPTGLAYLGEHIGFATLVQVQLMLENGTLPTDTVPGFGALGASRTRADGVWGSQTLRQLYAYTNENAAQIGLSPSLKNTILQILLEDIRAQRISDGTVYAAFTLCYLRPRAIRRRTDAGVQRSIAPAMFDFGQGSFVGLMTSGEDPNFISYLQRLPFPSADPQVLSVPPRFVLMNETFPPPPQDVVRLAGPSGIKIPGSNRNAPPGPYTLRTNEASPIPLPGGSDAPRTSPQIGQIVSPGSPPPPVAAPPPPATPGSTTPQPPVAAPPPPATPGGTTSNPPANANGSDAEQPAPPTPVPTSALASSVAMIDRGLPVIGVLSLVAGGLIFIGATFKSEESSPASRRTSPPIRVPPRDRR
jgi:hypothetical protein